MEAAGAESSNRTECVGDNAAHLEKAGASLFYYFPLIHCNLMLCCHKMRGKDKRGKWHLWKKYINKIHSHSCQSKQDCSAKAADSSWSARPRSVLHRPKRGSPANNSSGAFPQGNQYRHKVDMSRRMAALYLSLHLTTYSKYVPALFSLHTWGLFRSKHIHLCQTQQKAKVEGISEAAKLN